MTLDIQDFAAETSGEVSADDVPPELRQRLNDKLADLTDEEGGPSGPSGDLYDAVVNADSGSDDGSSPFETIQAAITNAESGDVISVEAGSYDGFDVTKENLTLFGPNAGIAGDSDERGPEAMIDGLVAVDAEQATVDGFDVGRDGVGGRGDGGVVQIGAVGEPGNGAKIANNIIAPNDTDGSNNALAGVAIESADDVTISGNLFTEPDGSETTIAVNRFLSNIQNLTVSGNTIETSLGMAFGGDVQVGRSGLSYSASVTNNKFNTSTYGITVFDTVGGLDMTIEQNEFRDAEEFYVQSGDSRFDVDEEDGIEELDLSSILNNNTFDPAAEVTTIDEDTDTDAIVAE